jgi:hypothetical protein
MNSLNRKKYVPVGRFEQKTSYCPLYLAWHILDEARNYFRTPIPEAFADKLAHRAEVVFAHQPSWQRRFKSQHGRTAILMIMRHWLAGVLARERPALFRDLPESFKVGQPLPPHSPSRKKAPHPAPLPRAERENHRPRFVHGCELLPA